MVTDSQLLDGVFFQTLGSDGLTLTIVVTALVGILDITLGRLHGAACLIPLIGAGLTIAWELAASRAPLRAVRASRMKSIIHLYEPGHHG